MFTRRLGAGTGEHRCQGGYGCPDVLEMIDGDFAVIGPDITSEAIGKLLPGTGCGPDERIVRVPRRVLISARRDIPVSP
jgi:hypothetical protein